MLKRVGIPTLLLMAVVIAGMLRYKHKHHPLAPAAPPLSPKLDESWAPDAPRNPALPTLFIIGDSTAHSGPDRGWGDHIAHYMDLTRINVLNRGVGGRSSRTLINEGHWNKALAEMKRGDFMLLQEAHNEIGDPKGPLAKATLAGTGDEAQDLPQVAGVFAGKIETVHTYGWYMRKIIDAAKARGVRPEILTPTARNIWKPGPDGVLHVESDMGYRDWVVQIGAQEHIPVIDSEAVAARRLQALGPEKSARLFPFDNIHSNSEGAEQNAHDIAIAIRAAHSPLAAYLLPDRSR